MMVKADSQAGSTVSTSLDLTWVQHETNTAVTYQRLFGDYDDAADVEAMQRRALDRSLVDRVTDDYDRLRKSPRLGAEDRQSLESHMALLADLEARLGAPLTSCVKPDDPGKLPTVQDGQLEAATRTNLDLLVAAFRCDRTRVATVMLCPSTDLRTFGFAGGPTGQHHAIDHSSNQDYRRSSLLFINRWYAKQVAYLLTKLDEVDPSTGRTYLDDTIVYWGNEDGCNPNSHHQYSMPVLLAGGTGTLRTGRYLDYRQIWDGGANGKRIQYGTPDQPINEPWGYEFLGRPYNSLLISLFQAFGLTAEDYQAPGAEGFGSYTDYMDQYDVALGHSPLPRLTT
jgi:hypothetical protein